MMQLPHLSHVFPTGILMARRVKFRSERDLCDSALCPPGAKHETPRDAHRSWAWQTTPPWRALLLLIGCRFRPRSLLPRSECRQSMSWLSIWARPAPPIRGSRSGTKRHRWGCLTWRLERLSLAKVRPRCLSEVPRRGTGNSGITGWSHTVARRKTDTQQTTTRTVLNYSSASKWQVQRQVLLALTYQLIRVLLIEHVVMVSLSSCQKLRSEADRVLFAEFRLCSRSCQSLSARSSSRTQYPSDLHPASCAP